MWKYRSKFVNIVIVCFLFLFFSTHSVAAYSVPRYIKIGLKYGSASVSTVTLQGSDGLRIALINGENTEDIMNIAQESLKATKDTYHLKLDKVFDSIEEAISFKSDLENANIRTYVFYDGSFKLYIGNFSSSKEAMQNQKSFNEISGYGYGVVEPKDTVVLLENKNGENIFGYDASKEIGISSKNKEPISVDGKKYRGSILLKRNGNISIINRLLLNEYLYAVVPKEMSGSWPIEALKAQAVAARNYAVKYIGKKHAKEGFDLCPTDHCQVYGGYAAEHPNSTKAVEETGNEIMVYDGEIVDATYHSNSGGKTESAENIWVNKVDYLKGVDDPYSIGYPNDNWSVSLTKKEIQSKLSQSKVSIGELIDIKIEEKSENDRVLKIKFIGSNGEKAYLKDSARSVLGLKSTWFDISKDGQSSSNEDMTIISSDSSNVIKDIANLKTITSSGIKETKSNMELNLKGDTNNKKIGFSQGSTDKYTFNGHGWGHGVGMSQWGAKKMAESGYSYKNILKHYYTGIKIEE